MRGRLGLLAHEPMLYRDLTARENLRYHARLHGVAPERTEELLGVVGMARRGDEPLHTLSRGMVQRLAVCRAVLHDPELLLLDEPTSHLDPAAAELVEPLLAHRYPRRGQPRRRRGAGARRPRPRPAGGAPGVRRPRGRRRSRRGAGALLVMSAAMAILRKDLRAELRAKQSVPAMALFSLTTFVVFHFGLDRASLEGDLAAGRAVGDAALRRHAGDQPAAGRRAGGGRLRRLPAGARGPHRDAPGQGGGAVPLPRGGGGGGGARLRPAAARAGRRAGAARACWRCSCWPTWGSRWSGRWCRRSAVQTRARDLIVPAARAPAAHPGASSRRRRRHVPLLAQGGAERASDALAGHPRLCTMSSSGCSPTRCSTYLLED